MKALYAIVLTLVIVGAINWGLVGLFDLDVVAAVFGLDTVASEAVYIAVGIAGLLAIGLYGRLGKEDRHSDVRHDDPHLHETARSGHDRATMGVTPTSPQAARAASMATGRTHATATPMGEAHGTGAPGASMNGGPAAGTTHDPNSVTTGTAVEPTRDVYPPKGEGRMN
jgi:uncharacterized membrane protein YuzA (DUF378 family)